MATGKARLSGGKPYEVARATFCLSKELKAELRKHLCDSGADWDDPLIQLENQLNEIVQWAKQEKHDARIALKKRDIIRELVQLERLLEEGCQRMVKISPEAEDLLPNALDLRVHAAGLETVLVSVRLAKKCAQGRPLKPRARVSNHAVAREMVSRALLIFSDFEIPASAAGDPYHRYASIFVKTLESMGAQIGISLSVATWRDIVSKAKRRSKAVIDARKSGRKQR